ncbi:MAG TPA: PepSY domain-containing protein [Gaiellaceae bacterium]|nr:PepSY domain-containing protein [Gaiellaceae bacterium]
MRASRTTKIVATVAAAVILALGGAAWAIAGGGDDEGPGATGPGADRARAAALAYLGGTANSVERDGEDGATWEVEVTKRDGTTVDVRLDERYRVVVVEGDSEQHDADD